MFKLFDLVGTYQPFVVLFTKNPVYLGRSLRTGSELFGGHFRQIYLNGWQKSDTTLTGEAPYVPRDVYKARIKATRAVKYVDKAEDSDNEVCLNNERKAFSLVDIEHADVNMELNTDTEISVMPLLTFKARLVHLTGLRLIPPNGQFRCLRSFVEVHVKTHRISDQSYALREWMQNLSTNINSRTCSNHLIHHNDEVKRLKLTNPLKRELCCICSSSKKCEARGLGPLFIIILHLNLHRSLRPLQLHLLVVVQNFPTALCPYLARFYEVRLL